MPFVHNNSVRFLPHSRLNKTQKIKTKNIDFEPLKAVFTEERIFVVNMSNKYKMGKIRE